jgi:hypothetical protein
MTTTITRAMERAYNYALESAAHDPKLQGFLRKDWQSKLSEDVSELDIVMLFSRVPVRLLALDIVDRAMRDPISYDMAMVEQALVESLRHR